LVMKVLVFLLSLVSVMTVKAQDTWKITLNGKEVLSTGTESEEKNHVKVLASDLKKKKDFTISYKEHPKKDKWERSISLVDEKGNDLLKQDGQSLKISNAKLDSFFKQSKTIRVYTWSLPTDPALKASVRIRRIHLCTLTLK
jgi:hypothetical protein